MQILTIITFVSTTQEEIIPDIKEAIYMKSVFCSEFTYDINNSSESVMKKFQENTVADNHYHFHTKHNSTKDFIGICHQNNFQIKAIISSFPVKRELFNPIIDGVTEETNNITKLHIKMHCRKFDLFFAGIFLIICCFATIFIGIHTHSVANLVIYLISILGLLIFFRFIIYINFKDAKERIENILSGSSSPNP